MNALCRWPLICLLLGGCALLDADRHLGSGQTGRDSALDSEVDASDASMTDGATDASMTDASMTDASMTDASMTDASMTDASMTDASMTDASMTDASMTDASMTDASTCVEGAVCFPQPGTCVAGRLACSSGVPVCEVNGVLSSGTECRPASGMCDLPEVCDGVTNACPSDRFVGADVVCRASQGMCDVAEVCSGMSGACPADVLRGAETVCRPGSGDCDVAETCDGASVVCPSDVFRDPSHVCRVSAGDCDVAEVCSGTGANCPTNAFLSASTTCRPTAGLCDLAEMCTGASASCPADLLKAAAVECRPAAGDCDLAEACNGSSTACPSDARRPVSYRCRTASALATCDVDDYCDGSSTSCTDARRPTSHVCRAASGTCDVAETCTGGTTCPSDNYQGAGVPCAGGVCDGNNMCLPASSFCNGRTAFSCTSFEVGEAMPASYTHGSAVVTPSTTRAYSGSRSLETSVSALNVDLNGRAMVSLPAAQSVGSTLWVRASLYLPAPQAGDVGIGLIGVNLASGAGSISLGMDNTQFYLADDIAGGEIYNPATLLRSATAGWECLEIEVQLSQTSGRIRVYRNGVFAGSGPAQRTSFAGGTSDIEVGMTYMDETQSLPRQIFVDDVIASGTRQACP